MRLLFCDSFHQEPADGSVYNSWSVIEFPVPVVLEQIQVLPRGVCVHEDLRADGQCGKTSPGRFRIDFFACDEKNDKSSTFENLCALEFNEVGLTTVFPRLPFVTSKLVCSGHYSVVTLAVFGAEASDSDAVRLIHERRNEAAQALLPTPPDSYKNVDDPLRNQFSNHSVGQMQSQASANYQPQYSSNESKYGYGNNDNRNYRSPNYDSRGASDQLGGSFPQRHRSREGFHGRGLLPTPSSKDQFHQQPSEPFQFHRYQHLDADGNFHPRDRNWNEENAYNMEKGGRNAEEFGENKAENEDENWDGPDYEEISDEELDEETAANVEAMVAEDMLLPSSMMNFNPFQMEVYPMSYFNSPDMSDFELIRNKIHEQQDGEPRKPAPKDENSDSVMLRKLIEDNLALLPVKLEVKTERHERQNLRTITVGKENLWVENLEKMVPLIAKGLPYLEVRSDLDYAFVLSTWAALALQLNSQIAKMIGLNIRCLKAGLNLAKELCHTSPDIVEHFSTLRLIENLIDILYAKHVASSIKIITMHVLDALTNWPMQLFEFMYGGNSEAHKNKHLANGSRSLSGYAQIIKLCLEPQTARVSAGLNQLVHKVHVYECMRELQTVVQDLVLEKVPDEYEFVSEDESSEEDYEEDGDANNEISADAIQNEASLHQETNMEISTMEHPHFEIRVSQDEDTRKVVATDSLSQEEIPIESQAETNDNLVIPLDSVFSLTDVAFEDKDMRKLAGCLKEITNAFSNPQETIGQFPLQRFPLSKQCKNANNDLNKNIALTTLFRAFHAVIKEPMAFDLADCIELLNVFRLAEESGLLSSVQILLTLPFVSGHREVFESCYLLLNHLMSTKSGLLYLLSNSDSVLHIVHHLLKSSPNLDVETPETAGFLGAKLSFNLQVLQSLDHVSSLLESDGEEEVIVEDLVLNLKTLFSLTYPTFGKQFVCEVLRIEDLLTPLLTCLWFPAKFSDPDPVIEKVEEEDKRSSTNDEKSEDGDAEKKEKKNVIQHKSAINGYAASLLYFLLTHCDDASYIYWHIKDITRACLSELRKTFKSEELKKYLSPLEKQLENDKKDVGKLASFIKEKTSLLEWSSLTIDGPGITTALRMLCHLSLQSESMNKGAEAESRLLVLELFSNDLLNVLLTFGEQLHKTLHYFCHGIRPMASTLLASTRTIIISMCQCTLSLLHLMLKRVLESAIDSQNIDNVHITQVAIALHSDLYVLLRPVDTVLLHKLTGKVVALLSLFFSNQVSMDDKPNPVISEMLKHAESQCDNFVPTLLLLSQLLPMPLPIITPNEPPENARDAALSSCKLWSAIITPHVEELTSFLLPLASSISRPLLEVVVILMQQIIDLSPSLALTVVKKLIDDTSPLLVNTILGNKSEEDEESKDIDEEQKELLMLSSEQITAILTFAEILTLPSAKAAMISCLSTEGEGVMDLWMYASHSQTPDEDVAAALLLSSVLVDLNLSLLPVTEDIATVSNAFPPSFHLKAIIDLAVKKIDSCSAQVLSRVFLVLGLLQGCTISVSYVRKALRNDEKPLFRSLEKIAEGFDASSDTWLNAVYNFVGFLSLLTDPTLDLNHKKKDRLALNCAQLKGLLGWEKANDHPLKVLLAKVQKMIVNDNLSSGSDVDYVCDKLSSLVQSLSTVGHKEKVPSLERDEIPSPVALDDQFSNRPVYVIGCSDDILHTRLSITAPSPILTGPVEKEDERMVQCDLIATAEKFCPGFDLAEELNKLAKAIDVQHVAEEVEAMEKRRQKMETFSARLGKSLTFMKRSHGFLMTQQRPGRGRGMRGRGNPSNRPNDLFRHRKQNTSRPPSMHVDDFVAADEEEAQKGDAEETPEPLFKSPPLPSVPQRHPMSQPFKPREFISRGGRGGRISRNTGNYRGRGGTYQGGNNILPLNKFRPRANNGSRGGHNQQRYRSSTAPRPGGRLSFSPHEGFKTNKQLNQGGWNNTGRDYQYQNRGRLSRPSTRGNFSFTSSTNNRYGTSFPRRGRAYNKPRGKHERSMTR